MKADPTAPTTETRRLAQVVRERLAEHRFSVLASAFPPELRFEALAEAIRLHQVATSHPAVPIRPSDHNLYRAWRALQEARS